MKTLILAAVLLALPVTVSAQDRARANTLRSIEVQNFQTQFDQALHTAALDQQQELYRDSVSPRRVQRAERAAALINGGDCEGARQLALRANDSRMLARIEHACEALTHSN